MLIHKDQTAVLFLGPIDGGRTEAAKELFGNDIVCTDMIRESLGPNSTDLEIFNLIEQVIKNGVKSRLRIAVNASLVDVAKRKLVINLFPKNYTIFYIICYLPLEERIAKSKRPRDLHFAQENLWTLNKSTILRGDFGRSTVLNYATDVINV